MKKYFVAIMMTLAAIPASAQSEERLTLLGPGGPITLRVPIEPKVITGLPYSAEVESSTVQTLADGNRIVKHTTGRVYRDAAGRVRREEDQRSGSPSVTIVDPVANMTYTVDNDAHIVWRSKMPLSPAASDVEQVIKARLDNLRGALGRIGAGEAPAQAENYKAIIESLEARRKSFERLGALVPEGASATSKDEDLPATTLDGIRATGHRRTIEIPADAIGNEQPITIVTEEWTSPDLKVLVMTRHADPRSGESTYRLRSISRSVPDSSLFQIPANYSLRDMELKREHE